MMNMKMMKMNMVLHGAPKKTSALKKWVGIFPKLFIFYHKMGVHIMYLPRSDDLDGWMIQDIISVSLN